MRILLLASLFPPVSHTGALRWARLCRRLKPMGCEFEVITTNRGFWSPPREDAELVPGVAVHRIAFPKNVVMGYLACSYWAIQKMSNRGGVRVDAADAAPGHGTVSVKARAKRCVVNILRWLNQLPQPIVTRLAFPHYSKFWARSVVKYCAKHYDSGEFDVIIATHPYPGTLLAAKELSRIWRTPWVADFRDPWTHDMQSPYRDNQQMVQRMWGAEGDTLETASAVVSINRQMCEYLNASEDKIHVITNSYEPSDYSFEEKREASPDRMLNLCYTGNVADDHEYRLFLDGLKKFQQTGEGAVVLHYYGGAFQRLSDYAVEIGLDGKVLINHGYVKHEEANQKLAEADCGVVFGWRGPLAKLVSTGKIFDSLGVKSPILGICSVSGSGMEDIITQSGSGSVLHSAREIADWLVRAIQAKGEGSLANLLAPHGSEKLRACYTTEKVAEDYLTLLRTLIR